MESIQNLIGALREELQEYGEMLALLDRQQQKIMARDAGEVFQSISIIKAQGLAIQKARLERERRRGLAAKEFGLPQDATFAILISQLPPDYRPLVKALVDENNELLVRVRQRARQNHVLLKQSLEMMQSLLNSLFPQPETRVYNDSGVTQTPGIAPRPFYEAVG